MSRLPVLACLLASSSSSSSSEWFCFSLALSFYHSLLPLQEEIVFYGAFILGWAGCWASRPITNILRVVKLNITYDESLRLNCPTASSPYQYPLSEPLTQSFLLLKTKLQTMASTSSLISTTPSNFQFCPKAISQIASLPQTISFTHFNRTRPGLRSGLTAKVQSLEFSGSFFEGGFQSEDDPPSPPGSGLTAVEEKEEPPCPPGLRQYETMAVLRPDMSEDERLTLTQKYEEVNGFSIFG